MGSLSVSKGGGDKPHAVCVPFPAQGHINPMFKLAKLLHFRGFHITFVHTEFNRNRLLRSHGPHYLDGLPSFNFEAIPDGLPPSDAVDSTQDIPSLCFSTDRSCIGPFRELLQKLNDTNSTGAPPVSCIVSDGSMLFTLDAAEELGVPEVLLCTASACGLLGYSQYRNLVERGLTPFKDPDYSTNGDLETVIDWIPAMEGITLKYMPSFVRTTNPDDIMLNFIPTLIDRIHRASAVLFNTFSALEQSVLSALPTHFPPLYPIGPLPLLLNQLPDDEIKSLGSNLWKEDPACLEWLDSKQPNSVVYVNFGSIAVMTPNQLVEFAWGLADSRQQFLWVVRPDLVTGDAAVLPADFMAETADRGILVPWCDQERVLSHPAVGGFLTHSGWNSTVESIVNAVAMISWPFFAEQQTNCWYCCEKWGIGMEIDSEVKRGEVEKQVRELMEGDKGKELRRRAMKWKRLAEEATATPTGSSYLNLEDLINNVLLSTPKKNFSN
ncbi:hypothetical protein Nepgr_023700 [Nepenthes gracilis]|uniref:Glycosyltransferase N-terminal domain-containing protein n=1 Tax=Nepenthes gracilis TaxID=150966 RepID=A0AAD3T4E4_NEPGR|nr:hypothetical protein Nepgr_023700 [Nepenthes gracilis]